MAQLVLSDSDGREGQRSPAKTQGPFGLACLAVIITNLPLEAVQERIRGMADREGTDEIDGNLLVFENIRDDMIHFAQDPVRDHSTRAFSTVLASC